MRILTGWAQNYGLTMAFGMITISILGGNIILKQKHFDYYPSSYNKIQELIGYFQEMTLVEGKDVTETEMQDPQRTVTLASLSAISIDPTNDVALQIQNDSLVSTMPVLTTISSDIFVAAQAAQTETSSTTQEEPEKPKPLFREHIVQKGDTISTIAALNGITSSTLLQVNGIKETSSIQPGDTLTIPAASGIIYTVKKGDTFSELTKKYKANSEKTLIVNNLASGDKITIGSKILLVNGTEPPKPTPTPAPVQPKTVASSNSQTAKAVEISRTAESYHKPVAYGISHGIVHSSNGVDISGNNGASIYAFKDGTVIDSRPDGWNGGYGNVIKVKHADGTITLYAHLQANYTTVGQVVEKGQVIGKVGSTGRSTGPHLHFEVRGGINPYAGYRGNV